MKPLAKLAANAPAGNTSPTRSPSNPTVAPPAATASKPMPYTRRFPRFAFDVRMQVKMLQAGQFLSCWGRSTELGQDGIGATLTGELQTGETVSLELPLPLHPGPLKVRAIVRYRHGLHYGFEFLMLSASQRNILERVCEMLAVKS